jgi:hypothetical protein
MVNTITFQATLQGDSGMFVEVPPEVLSALGPATRQRRVAQAPELLKSGRRTPRGRN